MSVLTVCRDWGTNLVARRLWRQRRIR